MKDTMTGIAQLCKRVGRPISVEHDNWDPAMECRLDSAKWPRDGEKGWGRLAKDGYWGNILPLPKEGEPWMVFTEWTDLIQLIGQAMYCRRGIDITKV